MTIMWPVHVLRPYSVAFDIASRSLAAPSSVSGKTQVVSSDAGIWKVTFGGIIVRTRNEVNVFRAISNLLEGRLNAILVPFCRGYQPINADAVDAYDGVPHGDDMPFDDSSEYVGGANQVTLTAPISARAVSANLAIDYGGTIEAGQHFSLGERLYRVRTVVYTGTNTATVTFRPPAREAAIAGATVDFDTAACRMRLATDSEMDLDLMGRRTANPTVNFIEDV